MKKIELYEDDFINRKVWIEILDQLGLKHSTSHIYIVLNPKIYSK